MRPSPTFSVGYISMWTDFYVLDSDTKSNRRDGFGAPWCLVSVPLTSTNQQHLTQQKQSNLSRNNLQILALQLMRQLAATINHNTFHSKTPPQ